MRYISEKEYNAEMSRIKHENESKARMRKLKAERAKGQQRKSKKISNSKLVLWAMVALVFCIAIWFMYESHRLCDLSQAYALLGIVLFYRHLMLFFFSTNVLPTKVRLYKAAEPLMDRYITTNLLHKQFIKKEVILWVILTVHL